MKNIRNITTLCASTLIGILAPVAAFGDGSEELGVPSIPIATGTDILVAGTGLVDQPGILTIDIPTDVTVEQVLLYWSGEGDIAGDDEILIDGSPVTGLLIGGPTNFYSNVFSSIFRADITDLGLIQPGTNSLSLSGLDYGRFENGAGMIVIVDDGSGAASIDLRDGLDLAFARFESPLDATVPQTYTFPAPAEDVMATLSLLVATVDEDRPNRIRVTTSTEVIDFDNFLFSNDGKVFDSLEIELSILAGEDSITVEVISLEDGSENRPASLTWIGSALTVPVDEGEPYEGCTPGFWKNRGKWAGYWKATGYSCYDLYSEVFGVGPRITLIHALWMRGNKNGQALLRHSVAGLLNAGHPDINYAYSEAEVLELTLEAWEDGRKGVINDLKDDFDYANNAGCDLPPPPCNIKEKIRKHLKERIKKHRPGRG